MNTSLGQAQHVLQPRGLTKEPILCNCLFSKVTEEQLVELKALPEEFDWRNVGGRDYVSPVRYQGDCGSCYAFSTLGMFEARVRILSNGTKTPVFSTQDIVSCSEYSQGCEGGIS